MANIGQFATGQEIAFVAADGDAKSEYAKCIAPDTNLPSVDSGNFAATALL